MPSTKEKIAAKKAAMTEEEKSMAKKKDAMRKKLERAQNPASMTEEDKSMAREKDAMRKRLERALKGTKKRGDMSPETLDKVRKADRKRWDIKQRSMNKDERDKVREGHKRSMAKKKGTGKIKVVKQKNEERNAKIKKKEQANIRQVLRMRKIRFVLSDKMKILERKKAREGMMEFRKEGRLREYMQRKRRGFCDMKWKKFLAENLDNLKWKKFLANHGT